MYKFPFDMNLTLEFGGLNNNDITEMINCLSNLMF